MTLVVVIDSRALLAGAASLTGRPGARRIWMCVVSATEPLCEGVWMQVEPTLLNDFAHAVLAAIVFPHVGHVFISPFSSVAS
jgi:hypothetical protein